MEKIQPIQYCPKDDLPSWWGEAISSKEMLRLKDVGMNCGPEYTHFPLFSKIGAYSRYAHSLGVGEIVWKFTRDPRQTLSALYHDIATPCFAHVVDFMNGDYGKQESTEEATSSLLSQSEEIRSLLRRLGLSVEDVSDYHRFPVADTPSPSLSSDRLEYTLSNAINLLGEKRGQMQRVYDQIVLLSDGLLGFLEEAPALQLGKLSLRCGGIYCCDEDRYAMETLARLLKKAIFAGIIQKSDLYGQEKDLIAKISASSLAPEWNVYRGLFTLQKSPSKLSDEWIQVDAKKRYIDPLIGERTLSKASPTFRKQVEEFLKKDFCVFLKGVSRKLF